MAELSIVFISSSDVVLEFRFFGPGNIEWVVVHFVECHSNQYVLLLLLGLRVGVEEIIEDVFKRLYFINWAFFLFLFLSLHSGLSRDAETLLCLLGCASSFRFRTTGFRALHNFGFPCPVKGFSTRICRVPLIVKVSSIPLLVSKVSLGILNLFGKLLDRFCHSFLQPRLEEEEECNEDKDVEEEKDELEPEQILFDEIFEVVFYCSD